MSTQNTADLMTSVNNMTATVAGKMGEIDEHLVTSQYLVQYKIYKDENLDHQEVVNPTSDFFINLGIDFTPKFEDSLTVVRASGNFRVIRADGGNGPCAMWIKLFDDDLLLDSHFGFLYSNITNNIHANPNMVYVDNRKGIDTRHYKLALSRHSDGTTMSYFPSHGTGTVSVEEYQNV